MEPGDTLHPDQEPGGLGAGGTQVFPSVGLSVLICNVGVNRATVSQLIYPTGSVPVPLFACDHDMG